MSQDLVVSEPESAPPAIGITDYALGIGDQDQALCVVQNLAAEVALFLQFALGKPQIRDIKQQPAILQYPALCVPQRKTVDQDMDWRSVLATQDLLLIVQSTLISENLRQFLTPPRREVNLRGNVGLQQFLVAFITKDSYQCVV